MQCPYCGADQSVCHDDGAGYSEDRRHEHTCTECDKAFVFSTSISFSYEPHKADCLNGAKHELKISSTYPRRYSLMRCASCDYERRPTDDEFKEAGIEITEPTT